VYDRSMAASTPKPQDVVGSCGEGRYLLWSGAIACGRPVEGLWTGGGVVRGWWSPGEGRRGGSAREVLGREVANLINVFNPQRIIISGEGVRAGDWLFGPMRASVARHVMPGLAEDTEIRIDLWGDDAWARGAASLVLRELFESPMHREPVKVEART